MNKVSSRQKGSFWGAIENNAFADLANQDITVIKINNQGWGVGKSGLRQTSVIQMPATVSALQN